MRLLQPCVAQYTESVDRGGRHERKQGNHLRFLQTPEPDVFLPHKCQDESPQALNPQITDKQQPILVELAS